MIDLFFVTALVLTTNTIPTGWLQWTKSYSDEKICQEVIVRDRDEIKTAIRGYLGKNIYGKDKLIKILDMQCMTYKEAVQKLSLIHI